MAEVNIIVEDIHPDITQDLRNAMSDVVLAFARLDSMVSHLLFLAFDLSASEGPILLGEMALKTKLDRLKQLYDHHGMPEAAQKIANLKAVHLHYVDIRNTIAHSTCSGSLKSNPKIAVFAPVKIVKGALDMIPVVQIHEEGMRRAATFARHAGDLIYNGIGDVAERRPKRPPEPPSFPPLIDPTLEKKGGGKQGKRREGRKGKPSRTRG